MDAGFVDDLVGVLRLDLPVFPVFFPVIRKFDFGDWFESDCILSQQLALSSHYLVLGFFAPKFSFSTPIWLGGLHRQNIRI